MELRGFEEFADRNKFGEHNLFNEIVSPGTTESMQSNGLSPKRTRGAGSSPQAKIPVIRQGPACAHHWRWDLKWMPNNLPALVNAVVERLNNPDRQLKKVVQESLDLYPPGTGGNKRSSCAGPMPCSVLESVPSGCVCKYGDWHCVSYRNAVEQTACRQ